MRINNVVGFSSNSHVAKNLAGRNVNFERKLKENEKPQIARDINLGYDILGKQVRALIIHGPNFPESKSGINQAMGTPWGQDEFSNFIKTFGFNYEQLGPTGARNHGQRSHYLSSIREKDPTLINLELLSGKEYAKLLPLKTLKSIIKKAEKDFPDNADIKKGYNFTRSNYERAEEISENALLSAYNNYIDRYNDDDKTIVDFDNEFEAFKTNPKNSWLNEYAVLHIIAKQKYNGNDWYLNWSKEDQDLIKHVQEGDVKATQRYDNILAENEADVDYYKFKQFIASKQAHLDKQNSEILKISDRISSQSSFDILTNKDIFLEDWCLGAKGGGYNNTPQFWGCSLVDPQTLFNPDGTLGKGGEYIKMKFQSALDGADMVRVDHVFAYANPYVYKRSFANNPNNWNKAIDENTGKEIHYVKTENLKGNAGFMLDKYLDWDKDGQYVSHLNIPGKENYRRIIPEIIIPALIEKGFDESDINKIAWETLGDWNPVFSLEERPALNLTGMHSLRYMSGDDPKNLHYGDYALIGTHDDPPAQFLIKNPNRNVWTKDYLVPFLRHSSTAPRDYHGNIMVDELSEQELVKAKFVDLFTSKTDKFALNFTDFFGIAEQPNVPGTNDDERPENWTLRLPSDYDENYYKSLANFKNEYAINIPEILRMSLENRVDSGEIPCGRIHEARELINKLARWEQILKEPETTDK